MTTRTIAAVFIACAFVLFAMSSCAQQRPGAKAQKAQQDRIQSQFP